MLESNRGHLEMEQIGDVTLVRFADEKILVGETIQTIAEQLHRIVTERARPKLMLDFTSVQYLYSPFLGELITLNKRVKAAGGQLILCNLDPRIHEVFERTRLDKLFDCRRKGEDEDPEAGQGGDRSRLLPPEASRDQSAALRPPPPEPE